MVLIYLQTGAPGEGDAALEDAPDEASTFLRTARGYSGPEASAMLVYADDPSIQADYEAAGAEVKDLSGAVVAEGSEARPDEEETALEATSIGSTQLQDMSRGELYEIAQEMEIEGRSDMDKQGLYEAIREKQ